MQNLKLVLKQLPCSQRELAYKVGVNNNTVWRWCNQPDKYRPTPENARKIIKIAAELGKIITLDSLL